MHICICTWEMSICTCMYVYVSVYLMSIWSESQMGVDAWKWTNTQTLISSCGECDSTAGNNPKPEQNFKELWASQTTNGCVQPHRATAAATATVTTLYTPPTHPCPSNPLLLLGRSCRTKGFKLLVETTTSTASFEWMATNGWARQHGKAQGRTGGMRTNERGERGSEGCMRMRMWMWG